MLPVAGFVANITRPADRLHATAPLYLVAALLSLLLSGNGPTPIPLIAIFLPAVLPDAGRRPNVSPVKHHGQGLRRPVPMPPAVLEGTREPSSVRLPCSIGGRVSCGGERKPYDGAVPSPTTTDRVLASFSP